MRKDILPKKKTKNKKTRYKPTFTQTLIIIIKQKEDSNNNMTKKIIKKTERS